MVEWQSMLVFIKLLNTLLHVLSWADPSFVKKFMISFLIMLCNMNNYINNISKLNPN